MGWVRRMGWMCRMSGVGWMGRVRRRFRVIRRVPARLPYERPSRGIGVVYLSNRRPRLDQKHRNADRQRKNNDGQKRQSRQAPHTHLPSAKRRSEPDA